jgi:LysR family transcriptional regulator, glycine cleavage system transcriptional activator
MSRRLPSLNALRAFEAAARHLSFSRAAEELHVTQGAVSRQINGLESHLGVPLFKRLTRALELTEHGQEYLPATRDAFDRIEQATLRLMHRQSDQVLIVSVLPTFAMRWLIPRLSDFTAVHPGIEVRMITSIRPVNFGREDIDVAIRVGAPPDAPTRRAGPPREGPRIDLEMVEDWTNVRADLLMPDVMVPVCSPALRDGPAPLARPEDLAGHVLLHTATRAHAWPDWLHAAGLDHQGADRGPAFGHFFMTMQAAVAGRGVALIPRTFVEEDIAAGKLVIPFNLKVESSGAYYLLCRAHQWDSPRVRGFREWLYAARDAAP